ncbi:MAG: HAMP domain-containing histidine kinase [Chitinispirillaceae bacterium]|nr:HAMP domain-containing histidine kinase [Chitinispirillaceae bacterium]
MLIIYNIFSFILIEKLKKEYKGILKSYAEVIERTITQSNEYEKRVSFLKEIVNKCTNPIIITDTLMKPIVWKNIYLRENFFTTKEIKCENRLSLQEEKIIESKVKSVCRVFKPEPVYLAKNILFGYLIYGDSTLIRTLYVMPFLDVGLIAVFIGLLSLAFHNIRIRERSNLWVGLAKETAHQLGTPISSMMGWIELLKTMENDNLSLTSREVKQVLKDMDSDVKRLLKITSRFSQIGSTPSMSKCDINTILIDVSSYFKLRLPVLKKRIDLEYNLNKIPLIDGNKDLLEWVFENLLKNAIDAIVKNEGKISLKTLYLEEKDMIRIEICDNGKGISSEMQKRIFSPGFTTKKRGWGLGLTLAKRIIEDYHNGEIYLKWSQPDKGSIFSVELPVTHTIEKDKNIALRGRV